MSQIFIPDTLEEACALLTLPNRILCAGATNLYVDRYLGKYLNLDIISLHKLEELKHISHENDGWHIGSLCTFDMLENELAGRGLLDALSKASSLVGGPQVRNRGTIGGNIVSASPSADSVPVLMALDAKIVLISMNSENIDINSKSDAFPSIKMVKRLIPICDFMIGVKQTAIRSNELLTEIIIPDQRGMAAFQKIGKRNALAIALCNVCIFMDTNATWKDVVRQDQLQGLEESLFPPERPSPTIEKIGIAIGSCAPTCVRAIKTEQALTGRKRPENENEWNEIKTIIMDTLSETISPIDDVRATASYRRKVAVNVVYKLIKELW